MYQLESPIYFYLIAVIPVMVLGFLWLQWWKKRAQNKFASSSMLAVLTPEKSTFKEGLKFSLFLAAILFLADFQKFIPFYPANLYIILKMRRF